MDWEAFYNRFREPDFIVGYEIQNRLGGGAFGEVYKARKHSIGKSYAIKFLKIDDEAQRDAVERELETVRHFAVVDHPNLVTIEDMGTAGDVPYLIMGYAGEDTLARRLKQGPLEPAVALAFFVQICRAVVALHERRLVHFDLKPSNVFLKGDVARVGDYGLSKMMVDGRSTLSFGRGTPHYMAPEMLRNRADHRADIYSLGVVLFECFARKLPFESAVPGTIHVRETDDPPHFPPEFPAGLRPIVERCLRLAPADRFQDVTELLSRLGSSTRPGDSVRGSILEFQVTPSASSGIETGARKPSSVAAAVEPNQSEARHAARELTRGAVEVARGVWDGLRAPSGTVKKESSAFEVRRGDATPVRDVLSMNSLTQSGEDVVISAPHGAPAQAEIGLTIPVPPPIAGGFFGTFKATLALSVEVLLTLGRGLSRAAFELVRSGRRNLGEPKGASEIGLAGHFARALRLCVFVLVLFILGGLTTLAGYYVLMGAT